MKHLLQWRSLWHERGIRARLLWLTLLPMVYLFVSVVSYSWYSRQAEAKVELAERARIVTTLLAQGSGYHIVTGNLSALRLPIHSLIESDRNIWHIELQDAKHRLLVQASASHGGSPETRYFEAAIKKPLIWVSLLGGAPGTPGTQGAGKPANPGGNAANSHTAEETVGYVRLRMSDALMREKQLKRFTVELLMAALAHGTSIEAEIHNILMAAVQSPERVKIGSALSALGQRFGGVEIDCPRDPASTDAAVFE